MADINKKKQIILFVPNIYPCTTGGLEIYYYHLVNTLKKEYQDYKITVLTDCKSYIKKNEDAIKIRQRLFIIRRFGLGTLSSFIILILLRKIQWKTVRCIIIPYTSNFEYNAFTFVILRYLFKIPYVVHIHGGGVRPWKTANLQKYFFKKAKTIAGVSEPIINEYKKRTGRNIEFLPPLQPFNKSQNDKRLLKDNMKLERFSTIILFVGTLKSIKGPEILLKAMILLGTEFMEKEKIGVVIVGDGPLKNNLMKLTVENDLENHIHFVGKIPNERVADYYSLADIFVIPSLYEGTPVALLQAMYNGLVCIGSDVDGVNNLISNKITGLLFNKHDHHELSEILKMLKSEKISSKKLGVNAKYRYHRHYEHSQHLKEFMRIIT